MLAVLLSLSIAFAQDTADTGATGDTAEPVMETEEAIEAPEGSTLAFPPETGDTGEPSYPSFQVKKPMVLSLRKPPDFGEGIHLVPGGSLVLLRQEDGSLLPYRVPAKAFLMPEPMYDSARLQARQLKICQPALDAITAETLAMAETTHKALTTCGDQFDVDEETIDELKQIATDQEIRAIVAEGKVKQARKGQVVAWAITGGVILGATAATAISLGTL